MTIRELLIGLGFKIDEKSEQKAEKGIQDLRSKATQILGAIGIGFSLAGINAITEEFATTNDQINQATKAMGDQQEIQQKILAAANETRSAYADTAKTVTALVQENSKLFSSVDEAIEFNNSVTKLLKSAGKTNDEISGIMESINKSFAKGKVDTETISQLLEKSPEAVALLTKRLGATSDQLEQMVSDGKISLEDLKGAFVDNADEINAAFSNTRYKISDALLNIRNQWGLWLADMDDTLEVSTTIGTTAVKAFTAFMNILRRAQTRIEWLAEKMGGADKLLRLFAITAGGLLLAFNFSKIQSGLQSILKAIGNINLKTVGIMAVIIILALLVEDFINFLQGKDSLIGEIFDRAGIGAENARQAIFNAFGKVRNFVMGIWNGIRSFLSEHNEQIRAMFSAVWNAITQILSAAFMVIAALARAIFGALQSFWEKWGDKIQSVFSLLAAFFGRTFERIISVITQFAEFLSAIFAGDIQGALQSLLGIFQTILEEILDFVKTIFTAIWTFIGDKVIAIKDTVVEGFQAAIDWITSLPEQALQWGADIINGIVDGIKGAIGKVGDAVKGVADKIKSFLHFSVPDEGPLTDYQSWMPDFMGGLAEGIDQSSPTVLSKIQALAGKMMDGLKKISPDAALALENLIGDVSILTKSAVAAPSTVQTSVGGNTSKVVTQNVNINNRFEGDRAGQQKSSEAMDKAADDSTSELARALQYVR